MGMRFRVLSDGNCDPDQFDMVYVTSPDVHGVSRGRFVMKSTFPGVVKHGLGMTKGALVAGVNVDIPVGLTELEEEGWSSGIQMPDMSTLRPMSWLSTEDWKVGSVICDFESNNGDRDKTSTREMAKTQMQALESMGFTPMVSASVEFTLFYKDSIKPIPLHENVSSLLAILSLAFEQSGILVESVGLGLEPGKLQITMKEQPALLLADDLFRLHGAVRSICCKAGYDVTFMAKALPKISSNIVRLTWHLLDSQKRNVFFDVDEPLAPTALARHFLSGQIKHNKAISALARPTVNCYRDDLNTALNGIDKDGHCSLSKTTHVDKRKSAIKLFRDGDAWKFQDSMTTSASNPYLVVAAVLAAGIDGLNNKIELTDKESHCNKPALSLTDALKNLNEDTFMKDQLGALFVKRFLYVKTEFEIKRSQKSDFMNGNNAHPYSSPHHVDRELYLEYL